MSSALAIRHTAEDSQARRNAESSNQAQRYWPGRAPKWLEGQEPQQSDSESEDDVAVKDEEMEDVQASTSVAAPVVVKKVADPRLARLTTKREREDSEEDEDVAAPRVLSRKRARSSSEDESGDESAGPSEDESNEEAEEEVTARRQAVRARLQQRRAQAEEEVLAVEGDEEEEEEEELEYETDSEDEAFGRQMLKPKFVTKKDRETIAEREALEKEELEAAKREKQRVAARAHETREIVISRVRAEEEAARAAREGPKEVGDIDTDDEKDEVGDYEAWRIRELQRIRRDREERESIKEAEAERERIKNMTPEERLQWERENPRELNKAPKKSWKFMQKYWHKGAFFQEVADNPHARGTKADDIYVRDYSAPTGEDKLNREMLPKVMQVKNFGRRGRTKYTHLVDQDTSVRDDYYEQDGLKGRQRKLTGTEQIFEKPKKFNT